jgi:hypothetical protein
MWDIDDEITKTVQILEKRMPGGEYDLEYLVRNYRDDIKSLLAAVFSPWYVLVDISLDLILIGYPDQETLITSIMEDNPPHEVDNLEIYHDGKRVNWKLQFIIEE